MKKILFTAHSLGLGGIETSLVSLLKNIDYSKYNITLLLEEAKGDFFSEIPDTVKILEYKTNNSRNIIYRKICNRLKLIKWKIKLKHKYDFSACYATYYKVGASLALAASKNNAIWIHNNYYTLYEKNKEKMIAYLNSIMINKFKKIIFVSKESLNDTCSNYPLLQDRAILCNNFIDYNKILKLSKEKIDLHFTEKVFVNVGRHDEKQKKIHRIIGSTLKLKNQGYKFKVLLIGSGSDTDDYKKCVKEYGLDDYIIFMGFQKNPYPYIKMSDAVLLSSDYEGYPVVFIETMILNKPLISTKVSDYDDLDGVYGIFNETSYQGVYDGMKKFLDDGFIIKEKFDYKKFNFDIMDILENKIFK